MDPGLFKRPHCEGQWSPLFASTVGRSLVSGHKFACTILTRSSRLVLHGQEARSGSSAQSRPQRPRIASVNHVLDENFDRLTVRFDKTPSAPCAERFRTYPDAQNGHTLPHPIALLGLTNLKPLVVFHRLIDRVFQNGAKASIPFWGEPRYVSPVRSLRPGTDPSRNDLDRARFIFIRYLKHFGTTRTQQHDVRPASRNRADARSVSRGAIIFAVCGNA